MVPTRLATIGWAWVSIAITGCGLLSCAGPEDDAADNAQNVEPETSERDASRPSVSPEPDASEPSATEPSATEPSATEPSATEPSATEPSATEPSATEPSATEPSATEPNDAGPVPDPPDPEPQEQQDPTPDVSSPASGGASGSHAGGSGGVDADPTGGGGAAGAPLLDSISFVQVEADVFEPAGCTAGYCHGGSAGDLTWGYAELVGAPAAQPVCGLTQRVVPGDPEASILWQRVRLPEAEQAECGEAMPKGGPPLTQAQAQLVYDWIAGGAAP